ncbi:Dipeptide transport system permease protein DppB [Actinokineospora spheciospongiae]|uniref:Dipeptide transport system permease protein DppB n=1 Tax=Actinokineospora spheciospongiae TaxID=909613 RepID=W7J8P4_9PSEU|nr:ABC transporter permease [Actinokineospora spheciospongiae]EWC62399.1 Dipeptide transport system permease protein DppB [Actinokineospora spheciospongiae]
MPGYPARRLGLSAVQALVVLVATFGMTALLPGDASSVVLTEHAAPEDVAVVRARLGLDQPLTVRFGHWISGLFTGDLGESLVTALPVAEEIGRRLAATALLAGVTLLVLLPLALLVGVASGLREGSRVDRVLTSVAVLLHAVPEFVLGLLLVAGLAVHGGLFPATAAGVDLLARPEVLVLPVTVLVARQLCDLARQIRIGVAEHSAGEVAGHLRLLGLPEHAVVLRHVLPGASAPVVQQLARTVEGLLTGAVVVESLFAVPGLGTGFVEAVQNRDIPQIQGYVLVFAGVVVLGNLAADLVAHRLTPRRELVLR